ncbi:hypothetical protein [Dietzia sp.]
MGSIEMVVGNMFTFARGMISAGLSAVEGFYEAFTGSLVGGGE